VSHRITRIEFLDKVFGLLFNVIVQFHQIESTHQTFFFGFDFFFYIQLETTENTFIIELFRFEVSFD